MTLVSAFLLMASIVQQGFAHPRDDPYQPIATADIVWPEIPDVDITELVYDYEFEGITYEGYVAYPTELQGPLPAVMIAHQYLGLGDMEKFRSKEMAAYGYVAFASDMYGKENRPADADDAVDKLEELRADPEGYHAKMEAAMEEMRNLRVGPSVDVNALFVNGYCAGGEVAFELARLDTEGLIGAAGFHPLLDPLVSSYDTSITAAIQAHHAELDSSGDQGLSDFEDELRSKNVSTWTTLKYGNCEHGWTDPTGTKYRAQDAADAHYTMIVKYASLQGVCASCTFSSGGETGSTATLILAIVMSISTGLLLIGGGVYVYRTRNGKGPAYVPI